VGLLVFELCLLFTGYILQLFSYFYNIGILLYIMCSFLCFSHVMFLKNNLSSYSIQHLLHILKVNLFQFILILLSFCK
jgi:hypothetical protein